MYPIYAMYLDSGKTFNSISHKIYFKQNRNILSYLILPSIDWELSESINDRGYGKNTDYNKLFRVEIGWEQNFSINGISGLKDWSD